jgi:predicted amidohydrolase
MYRKWNKIHSRKYALNQKNFAIRLIILLVIGLSMSACSSDSSEEAATTTTSQTNTETEEVTTVSNEADVSVKLLNSPYKVAAVNAPSVEFDLNQSIERANEITSEAAAQGATLVTFGELWLPGYPKELNYDENWGSSEHFQDYVDNALEVGSEEWKRVLNIAKTNSVYLSIGFSEREGDNLYISQALIDPDGELIQTRRKVRPSGSERKFFSDAEMDSNLVVINSPLGRLGMLECWEHLHPQMTYPMHAQQENLHIAAWPYLPSDSESPQWWENTDVSESAARYYAINGGTWVITPAVGEAFIMNPLGEIVVQASTEDSTDFILAEIDPSHFADTPSYNSSGEYSWGVLNMIRDSYKGAKEEDLEHEKLNIVDINSVK